MQQWKEIVVSVAILLFLPTFGIAAEVSLERARPVALNWLNASARDKNLVKGAYEIIGEEIIVFNNETVGYNFLLSPVGHIIVPALDELPSVKLYSFTSTLSMDQDSEIAGWIKEELYKLKGAVRSHTAEMAHVDHASTHNGRLWAMLEQDPLSASLEFEQAVSGAETASLGPLLPTAWNQDAPYNMHTPLWYDGQTTYTGCVATAAAQIMKYWNYPATGQGVTSYTWNNGSINQLLSANFAVSTYDWNSMTNSYGVSSTSAQKEAVAKLMSDVGVAFQMVYGPDGSGANTMYGVTVFPTYFKYKNTVHAVYRSSYASDSAWMQVFKNEVQNGRLSQLRIRDPLAGGHSIVVDGYLDSPLEQIHLNMGWAGSWNGWYVSNNIVTGSYNWSDVNYQGAVIGIEPPTTFTVTAKPTSSTDIVLGWQDKSLGESGFKVQRKTGACNALSAWTQATSLPANTVTFTNSGLAAATTYAYRIVSLDSHGASQYSTCVSAATAAAGTPNAPTGLNTAAGANIINLAWVDNSSNETRFDVYRKVGTDAWTLRTTMGAGAKSFSDTTATNNGTTSYSYYIKACNTSGCSPASSIAVVPFKPLSLTATQSGTSLGLSWTDQSADETGFKLERKSGACLSTDAWAVRTLLPANTGQYADTGLTIGQTYSYRVKAYKRSARPYAFGNSQYSNCVTKTLQ